MHSIKARNIARLLRDSLHDWFIIFSYINGLLPHIVTHINKTSPMKVRKTTKIRNHYNQVPHLTQDTTHHMGKLYLSHRLFQNSKIAQSLYSGDSYPEFGLYIHQGPIGDISKCITRRHFNFR